MIALSSAAAVTLAIAADVDEPVTLKELPEEVRAAIVEAAKGGEITELERELVHGQLVYEAEIRLEGHILELVAAGDGTILERAWEAAAAGAGDEDDDSDSEDDDSEDETISLDDVPDAARQALLNHADGHEILEVEVERAPDDAVIGYEAAWRVDGRMNEVLVTVGGALVELEQIVDRYSVPPSVRDAAAELIESCDEVVYQRRVIVVYTVAGKQGEETRGLAMSPTGRVLERR